MDEFGGLCFLFWGFYFSGTFKVGISVRAVFQFLGMSEPAISHLTSLNLLVAGLNFTIAFECAGAWAKLYMSFSLSHTERNLPVFPNSSFASPEYPMIPFDSCSSGSRACACLRKLRKDQTLFLSNSTFMAKYLPSGFTFIVEPQNTFVNLIPDWSL